MGAKARRDKRIGWVLIVVSLSVLTAVALGWIPW
jgi:flagellar basal body-associated protein FliL